MSCKTVINENKAYWSKRAPGYSEVNIKELRTESHFRWQQMLDQKIIEHFPDKSRAEIRILEVGTGPGFFAILLAELGYHPTAIDLTPEMLQEARKNAGSLAPLICFMEMNAEALDFSDASFDVILSRNLTWNLPHPLDAYSEWTRVLCKEGLLLNFDANWYAYLFDEKAQALYNQDRENTAARGIKDENIGDNFDAMEDIARRIPLSGIFRPEWDIQSLEAIGMSVKTDENIWQILWSEEEKINFSSTPMFLIEARKL